MLLTDPEGSGSEREITERVRFLLVSRGYAAATVNQYVAKLQRFQSWTESRGDKIDDATSATVLEYLSITFGNGQGETGVRRHCTNVCAALSHLLSILGKIDNDPKAAPMDEGLKAFAEHMESTCGLAPATRLYRLRYTAEFLSYLSERNSSAATAIFPRYSPNDVTEWMTKRVQGLKPSSASLVASSLRSYLRYRELYGTANGCPASVVPTVPNWRLGNIPRHLDETGLEKLLGTFDQSAAGRRDLAMAILMSEMGLRASEVAHLEFGDIDWRSATLTIRGLKACRDRVLPLTQRSGQAIAAYLKSGRLPTDSRALFVRHSVPKGTSLSAELVRCAMRRAYARAGFPKEWTGTHLLRHTAATRMQQGGASLKEMADVLGHRSIDTTIIYTKVDIPALRTVALPWPEAL
jgi:site-specific recombinase XerD